MLLSESGLWYTIHVIKRGVTEMTKQQIKKYYTIWKHRNHISPEHVYSKPSLTKMKIYDNICEKCYRQGGHNPSVLTYNTFMFTIGYAIGDMFYVETPTKTLTAKISEMEN